MFYKILLGAIALIVGWVGLSFFQLKAQLFEAYEQKDEFVIGPEEYDLTIVEFVLYSCPVCRSTHAPFKQAMEEDGKIRYIPRPIAFEDIHEGQKDLVLMTYAAAKQGKFAETFEYMLLNNPDLTDREINVISELVGLDAEKIRQDMQAPDVIAALEENEKLFNDWDMRATPAFLIGKEAIYRIRSVDELPTKEDFKEMFAKAR